MTLFHIKGIKIKVHPLLLVMSVIWTVTGYISTALIVYAALLLHEIAHMIAAAAFRVRIYEMELLPFGSAVKEWRDLVTNPSIKLYFGLSRRRSRRR